MKLLQHSIVSDFTNKSREITVVYECDFSEPIDVQKLEARLAELGKSEQAPAKPVNTPKLNLDTMLDAHPLRATALITADLSREPEAPAPVDPRTMFIRSINQHFAKIDLSGRQEVLDAVLDGEQQFLEGSKAMKCLRELDVAMVAAVADRLSLEVDVAAQYIEQHRKAKQTSAEPSGGSLEELWNQTMAKPQVQSKSALIQKMVAALALMTAQEGKTTVADMQAKADELSKVVGSPEEWAVLKNPSVGSSKTKLQVLAPIIGNTVGVKVV